MVVKVIDKNWRLKIVMDSIVNRKGPRNKKKLKAGNLIKSLPLFGALYEDGKEQKHFIKLLSSFI